MIVLLTVILLGGGTVPMLSLLRIRVNVPDPPRETLTLSQHVALFEWIDKRYFRNLFRRNSTDTLVREEREMSTIRHSASADARLSSLSDQDAGARV